jgi:hypothetical protein
MVAYRCQRRIQIQEKEESMKQAKLLEFVKQWKSIERRRKDLDYDECRWCADVRAEFPTGTAGDKRFREWLSLEIGISVERQDECVTRAASFSIVPDPQQWHELGGYLQIRKLVPLDKAERVAVIGAAKASGYRITTIVRQRESKEVIRRDVPDIVLLAEFIESLDRVPEELRDLARKYVRAKALHVA